MLPVLRTVQVVADAVVIVDVVDRPDVVLVVDEIINKVAVDNHQTEDDTKFVLALRVHKTDSHAPIPVWVHSYSLC